MTELKPHNKRGYKMAIGWLRVLKKEALVQIDFETMKNIEEKIKLFENKLKI